MHINKKAHARFFSAFGLQLIGLMALSSMFLDRLTDLGLSILTVTTIFGVFAFAVFLLARVAKHKELVSMYYLFVAVFAAVAGVLFYFEVYDYATVILCSLPGFVYGANFPSLFKS